MNTQQFAAKLAKEECIIPYLQTNQEYINKIDELLQKTIVETLEAYEENKDDENVEDLISDYLYDYHQDYFFTIFSGGIINNKEFDKSIKDNMYQYLDDCFESVEKYIMNYIFKKDKSKLNL